LSSRTWYESRRDRGEGAAEARTVKFADSLLVCHGAFNVGVHIALLE
jgi:hypothetical protein